MQLGLKHRRWIKTKAKAKVVAFIPFLGALAIMHYDD